MRIYAEWESLREVLVHQPGLEAEYAMLAPRPFLFERPFNISRARDEHKGLQQKLKENGIKVLRLRDELRKKAAGNHAFREKLEKSIAEMVGFSGNSENVDEERKRFIHNLRYLDVDNLLNFLILKPSVELLKDVDSEVPYPTIRSDLPLANLYFMRDQQAVAGDALIVGKMKKRQRQKEVTITETLLSEMHVKDGVFKVTGEGFFEGGDFMPAGRFALIGTGPRTNVKGALQVISFPGVKFDEFLVVDNPLYDFLRTGNRGTMINMHLDTYFNIADEGLAVTSVELAREAKGVIYTKDSDGVHMQGETTLHSYLKEKGYNFVHLRLSEQMSYASNFLTLKPGRILGINVSNVMRKLLGGGFYGPVLESAIRKDLENIGNNLFPNSRAVRDFGLDIIPIDLSELTGGYGGAHCMTAAISRS